MLQDKSVKISIIDINDSIRKIGYSYSGNNVVDFKNIFKTQFLRMGNPAISCTADEQNTLIQEGNDIWNKLQVLILQTQTQVYSNTVPIGTESYRYTGSFNSDNAMKISIENVNDASKKIEYTYSGQDVTAFMGVFQRNFLKVDGISATDPEKDGILKEGNNLWLQLISMRPLARPSFAPEAGTLSVAKKIRYYISFKDSVTGKDSVFKSAECEVQDVHIEFNSGYIENIYLTLSINGIPRTYQNIYGIGFTSVENQNKLRTIRLFQKGAKAFPSKKATSVAEVVKSKDNFTFINLGELLDYKPRLEVDRRDYSPMDTAIILYGGQNVTLYKEQTNKLLEARIYTDFVGLQDDKPNGLVQTEVEKRININSNQLQTPRFIYGIFKSVGIFQFIKPSITLSKLEQHNKRLVLGDLDSIRLNPGNNDTANLTKNLHRYATPLVLYQHQSFTAGFDLNVVFFSNHNLKYNLYFNLGTRLGITPVTDSATHISGNSITKTGVISEYAVNTLQIIPEARLLFLPEERFNFSIAYRALFIKPFSSSVQLLSFDKQDPDKFLVKKNAWLNTLELLMAFNVSKTGDGKLFGRVRFNSEVNNFKNNFAQIQLGYSAYILGNSK